MSSYKNKAYGLVSCIALFPAPLEAWGVSYLYNGSSKGFEQVGFRPLSRYGGFLLEMQEGYEQEIKSFPAPREAWVVSCV